MKAYNVTQTERISLRELNRTPVKTKLVLELDSPCSPCKVITLTYILILSDIFRCGRVHFRQPFL